MKPEGRIVIDTDMEPTHPSFDRPWVAMEFMCVFHSSKGQSQNLFAVNHLMACLRQNVASVRIESWHISKCKRMLDVRPKIYIFFSNSMKKKTYKRGKKRVEMTPAMHLGILNSSIVALYEKNIDLS